MNDETKTTIVCSGQCSIEAFSLCVHLKLRMYYSALFALPCTPVSYGLDGQGSQKLYNWQNIVSPPHYRNAVHHPHDIICLYCRGHQDESEYIYFYIVYVSHLSSIDEYCRTFGSNTVILACLQTHIAHSILLHKKSINCNQTIYDSIRKLSYCNCFLSAFVCLKDICFHDKSLLKVCLRNSN